MKIHDDPLARRRCAAPLAGTVLIVLAACAGDAFGPSSPSNADETAVIELTDIVGSTRHVQALPYHGTIETESTPAQPPAGCDIYTENEYSGQATHVGDFIGSGATCGFDVRIVAEPPINPGGGGPPFLVADFVTEQIHVAANGDELWISGVGLFVQSLSDGRSGFEGVGEITGGSGRFDGASGAFDIVRSTGAARFDGWIEYAAGAGE